MGSSQDLLWVWWQHTPLSLPAQCGGPVTPSWSQARGWSYPHLGWGVWVGQEPSLTILCPLQAEGALLPLQQPAVLQAADSDPAAARGETPWSQVPTLAVPMARSSNGASGTGRVSEKGHLVPCLASLGPVARWGLWDLRLILASLPGWDPAGWSCPSVRGLGYPLSPTLSPCQDLSPWVLALFPWVRAWAAQHWGKISTNCAQSPAAVPVLPNTATLLSFPRTLPISCVPQRCQSTLALWWSSLPRHPHLTVSPSQTWWRWTRPHR